MAAGVKDDHIVCFDSWQRVFVITWISVMSHCQDFCLLTTGLFLTDLHKHIQYIHFLQTHHVKFVQSFR